MDYILQCEIECEALFKRARDVEDAVLERVQRAFKDERVQASDFAGSTGYGYGDIGRDKLERVYARSLECEAAFVRPQIASGTNALALAMRSNLTRGDTLICATGKPYDTLDSVIGFHAESRLSLVAGGVKYVEVPLLDGLPDLLAITKAVVNASNSGGDTIVYVQRSRGYTNRPTLTPEQIGGIAKAARESSPRAVVMVDNSYGEFTFPHEPTYYGADAVVGSLIKNIGGGIAPSGGYIAGKKGIVERAAELYTGVGAEIGSHETGYRLMYQGLFMSPHTVREAICAGILEARVLSGMGYIVTPAFDDERIDLVRTVRLGSRDAVIKFCAAVQESSPVDAFAVPEPWDMPGYADEVIMAAGTFVGGASIEMSCDAPMREPYDVYIQGALSLSHAKLMLRNVERRMG